MKEYLKDTPYRVIEAAGGMEGLRLAKNELPDIIFLDLVMPDMSGFDVLRALKDDRATAHIPVIISTSKVLEEKERELLREHAASILSKEATSGMEARAHLRDALLTLRSSLKPEKEDTTR